MLYKVFELSYFHVHHSDILVVLSAICSVNILGIQCSCFQVYYAIFRFMKIFH